MENDNARTRMLELMAPIEKQIMMCDDRADLLMIASAMMVYAKSIFDNEVGIKGRKMMFKDFADK
jgi:hypothetical protein